MAAPRPLRLFLGVAGRRGPSLRSTGLSVPAVARGSPLPLGVNSKLRDPGGGGAFLSKPTAAAAAVAMDTKAAPIGVAFWGRGLLGNHTHFRASRSHLGTELIAFAE